MAYNVGMLIFTLITGYSIEMGNYKRYRWLISSKYQEKLDTLVVVAEVRDSDIYSTFNVEDLNIGIHEFNSLMGKHFAAVEIEINISKLNKDFTPAQVIHEDVQGGPTIRTYWNMNFREPLQLQFNSFSKIDTFQREEKYLYILGEIDELALKDAKRTRMHMQFKNKDKRSMVLCYRHKGRFFLMVVTSTERAVTLKDLEVFNLRSNRILPQEF